MKILIQLLHPHAHIPTQHEPWAAWYDLYSIDEYILAPGERKLFSTGIALQIPQWYYGRIAPRSGLAYNHGIDVLGGVIDASYRWAIGVILLNTSDTSLQIEPGMRIAQLIIESCHQVSFTAVDTLDESSRWTWWFGSTGK